MKGFRSYLNEFWKGSVVEAKQPTAKIVKSDFSKERPEAVTFEKLVKYHDLTPQIQVAVSSYAELMTGTDMVVNSDDQAAQDLIEEWIRKNNFYDPKISGREIIGVLSLCLLAVPIIYILPFTYYALLLHSMLYFVVHNLSHKYPNFAKRFVPWHYDHHMGKNQNTNWCVVHPLADYIFKTRSKNEY